jgi:GTP-binding protein Era
MTEEASADIETKSGTVALLGRPNVGKSSLMNAMLGLKIAATTHKPQTTRRQLRGILTSADAQVIFVDTPGLHEARDGLQTFMVEEAMDAASGVDVVAWVVEAKKPRSADDTPIDERDVAALESLQKGRSLSDQVILVVNKIDRLEDKKALLPLLQGWSERFAFVALVPVSAEKKRGLAELREAIVQQLPAGPHLFPEDAITDASERDIAAELIREKAMLELKEELPYKLAVEIEEFDESRRDNKKSVVDIRAVLHVEREGQKRIVVGKGGERIKAIGTRARKELERLLDAKVMLRLFVHVEPNWPQTEKGLGKVGYKR